MSAPAPARPPLVGTCATAGCKEQHLHPITGDPPDWHFVVGVTIEPRWRPNVYKRAPKPGDRWYRPREIAAIAGGVDVETVRRWVRDHGLPASKRPGGRSLFIRGRDLEAWLQKQSRIAVLPTQQPKREGAR